MANFAAVAVGKTSVKTWADRNTGNTIRHFTLIILLLCLWWVGLSVSNVKGDSYTKAFSSTNVVRL